jgi:hypothetical protein
LQVGHLQALPQQLDGLLVRRPLPLARAQAAALGVAAAWRLGHWDELAEVGSVEWEVRRVTGTWAL